MSRTKDRKRDVDQLVAAYLAVGRIERRGRGCKRLVGVAVAAALASSGWVGWHSDLRVPFLHASDSRELQELRAVVTTELEELSAVRADLAIARSRYDAESRALEAQLAAFGAQYAALEAQQAELAAQNGELKAAIAEIDAQREQLLAAQARGSSLERELAAITAERQTLEQRWQRFADEGQQLSSELESLELQRRTLEVERANMDRQRRELEFLLAEPAREGNVEAEPVATTSAVFEPALGATSSDLEPMLGPLTAAAMDPRALDGMRGGVLFGNGMNVAIGLTRTAQINGEQQFSSSLNLDSFGAGLDPAALRTVGQFVLQNGAANSLSSEFLQGWSDGFGTIIQNSLDNQEISTTTIYDVSIQDVGNTMRGLAASQALSDSLSFQH